MATKENKNLFGKIRSWPQLLTWILMNIYFVGFLVFLGILYISLVRHVEGSIYKIGKLNEEVERLRWEYMGLQSELMYERTQSQVVEKMKKKGLSPGKQGPKRIIASDDITDLVKQ